MYYKYDNATTTKTTMIILNKNKIPDTKKIETKTINNISQQAVTHT